MEKKPKIKKGYKIPRMTEEKLREFVNGYCSGQIFTSANIHASNDEHLASLMRSVFMPLAFGGLKGVPKRELRNLGVLWEWNSKAGLRSINGMPTFTSCNMLHKDDWDRARNAVNAEMDRRKSIKV